MHATAPRPSLASSFRTTSGCFWMRGAAGPCGGWHGCCLHLGHRSRASYLEFGRSFDDGSGPIEAREPNRRFGRRHRRPLECVPLLASPRAAFQGPVTKSLVIMVREKVTFKYSLLAFFPGAHTSECHFSPFLESGLTHAWVACLPSSPEFAHTPGRPSSHESGYGHARVLARATARSRARAGAGSHRLVQATRVSYLYGVGASPPQVKSYWTR